MKPHRPLAGVQVLDLTAAWAGPMATRLLADLGATVIKVEGPARPDLWRGRGGKGMPHRYPERELGERPHNRNAWFNSMNHGKFAITLDLKQPDGTELALELASRSNVVISNFPPGVPERLGLGYEQVLEVRPDVIYVEMPAFGNDGPQANYSAWGPNLESAMGAAAVQGYGDGKPVVTGYAILDPIGGLFGAAAVMTALMHWQRTGEGQRIEVAQLEGGLQFLGEFLLEAGEGREVPQARGNWRDDAAPHDAFPCRNLDEWVAIACFTEEQWRGLCAVSELDTLAADKRFATLADRLRHRKELGQIVSAWTKERDKHEVAKLLQQAGVPAAPVNNAKDLSLDEHLRQRGYFDELSVPDAGSHRYPGLPYRFNGEKREVSHPSPAFGEHNRYVLQEMLGVSDQRYDELLSKRVVAQEPLTK